MDDPYYDSETRSMIFDDYFFPHKRQRVDPKWVDPKRTRGKHSHPYAYDAFYHWRDRHIKRAHAVYHDRMQQWDWDKFEKARKLITGKWFYECTREELSAFLSAYFDKEIKAVALVEGCNQTSGYPYWVFYYREVK